MRAIFLVFFLFSCSICAAQLDSVGMKILYDRKKCGAGIDSAIADEARGKLGWAAFEKYNYTMCKVLEQDYHLVIRKGSLKMSFESIGCYNSYMSQRLIERYGKDFFKVVLGKADSLDLAGLGNREAKWLISKDSMQIVIANGLHALGYSRDRWNQLIYRQSYYCPCGKRVKVRYNEINPVIMKDGSVSNFSKKNSFDTEVYRILNTIPRQVATSEGESIDSQTRTRIEIDLLELRSHKKHTGKCSCVKVRVPGDDPGDGL